MSKNQEVDLNSLEKIGHYLLLDRQTFIEGKKFPNLSTFSTKDIHILRFFGSPEFKVDDKGSNRVVSEILVDTKKINKLKKRKER